MQGPIIPEKAADKLDKAFELQADTLAQKKVDEALVLHPNQLISPKTLLERYKKEIQGEFSAYRAGQIVGASKLALALQALASEMPELFTNKVVAGIDRIAGLSDYIAKHEKAVTEQLNNGTSLQEIAKVDDTVMDILYQAAKRLYDKALFADAADVFGFLTGFAPSNYIYWLGLANAEYQQRRFHEALQALHNVCSAIPNDPACHLTASRCYVEIGQIDKAVEALELSLVAIRESQECMDWKEGIEQEKQHLQQMLK